jgi:hypothetical protein
VNAQAASSLPTQARLGSDRLLPLLPTLVAFAPVLCLAAAQGGYFPTSWGWASVPLLWAVALALVMRDQVRLSTSERLFLLALAALAGWTALSYVWSAAPAQSVLEVERTLVYVSVVAAVLMLSRGRLARNVLGGVVAAICAITLFSLLSRLVPDRVGIHDREAVSRLAQPIGYWNGLGIFAGMGALVAFGFAARARTTTARAACGGALIILLPTLYFTFGRAVWIALAAGLVTAVAIDRHRLQMLAALLVLAPLPAISVLLASRERGLTHTGTALARATSDGHRLAFVLLLLLASNALLAAVFAEVEKRIEVARFVRVLFALAVVAAVALGLATVFGRYGSPVTITRNAYRSFTGPPPPGSNDLNRRLLSFSGNGRAELWRLAWADAKRHPVLGAGAGTYERYYLRHQPADVQIVRDAHGLYIETLAELGPLGLALLIAVLAVPLVSLRYARRHPLASAAAGAYVAYLVHTGVDWDWELSAVTAAGLLCGVSILLMARRWRPPRPLPTGVRLSAATVAVLVAGFAAIGLLGNAALSRSTTARREGKLARSATDARRAQRLMPWSPAPWDALGQTQLAAGLDRDARRSFRRAISIDAGDWKLWYDLAGASSGAARRQALRNAVALFPRSGVLAYSTPAQAARKVR